MQEAVVLLGRHQRKLGLLQVTALGFEPCFLEKVRES